MQRAGKLGTCRPFNERPLSTNKVNDHDGRFGQSRRTVVCHRWQQSIASAKKVKKECSQNNAACLLNLICVCIPFPSKCRRKHLTPCWIMYLFIYFIFIKCCSCCCCTTCYVSLESYLYLQVVFSPLFFSVGSANAMRSPTNSQLPVAAAATTGMLSNNFELIAPVFATVVALLRKQHYFVFARLSPPLKNKLIAAFAQCCYQIITLRPWRRQCRRWRLSVSEQSRGANIEGGRKSQDAVTTG